jgi:glycosyltransferase involved in cell wall biosynthesis
MNPVRAELLSLQEPRAAQQAERVCVIIPMYRVEPYIREVIAGIPAWVWKIIVVDDASPDGSAQAAQALGDPRLVLLQHAENQGVGGAVLTGMRHAGDLGASVAVKMDGDGQMSPAYLWDLVEPILAGRADYTKGNRFFHRKEISRMPAVRRFGNLGLSFLTKLASGYWNVFDPTNGYLAIHMETFQALDSQQIHRRYFFETSMLLELSLARAVVLDVPMPARYQGEISSLSVRGALYEFSHSLMRGFLRRVWLQYFVLDFSLGSLFLVIGLLMCLFGGTWGAIFWDRSIRSGVPASTGTVMIAVVPLILGFQLLLQALAFDIQNAPKTILPRGKRENRGKA